MEAFLCAVGHSSLILGHWHDIRDDITVIQDIVINCRFSLKLEQLKFLKKPLNEAHG